MAGDYAIQDAEHLIPPSCLNLCRSASSAKQPSVQNVADGGSPPLIPEGFATAAEIERPHRTAGKSAAQSLNQFC